VRALFTSLPATGHVHSILPLALAARDAGHEVAICTSPAFAERLHAYGLTLLPGGSETFEELLGPDLPPYGPDRAKWVREHVFADSAPERLLPDLERHVSDWRPDVIVRESAEFAAYVLAERTAIPHASVATGSWWARDDCRAMFAPALAVLRERHGLPADPDGRAINRYLTFSFMPSRWDGDAERPPTLHHVRYENPERPGEELPEYLDGHDDEPLVLAALGTLHFGAPGLLDAIIAGLGSVRARVVVAIGPGNAASEFGAVPSNVRLEPYVPQVAVLSRADAFLTHGGFNSTKEALSLGIPLVVTPIGADQFYTAERVEALGLGRTVAPAERTPEVIGARVAEVMSERRYPEAARRFATEMAEQPPIASAVTLLERLARERSPILRRD
jgi:UDP:flavonoid glycosyltransferase YjiC (YdhE family)